MTKDEALKLALKAFEWNYNTDLDNIPACEKWAKMLKENIAAIKEALAQPEQEPVAWSITYHGSHCNNMKSSKELAEIEMERLENKYGPAGRTLIPLYTTPPQRKPLTDEEIILIVAECAASHQHTDIHFARAIERAHGIKELV